MKLVLSRWVVIALALLVVPVSFVPGSAEKPITRIAVEDGTLAIQNLPPGTEVTRISSSDVSDNGLGKYDALIVSRATFEAALSDSRSNTLKKFVEGHRAIAIVDAQGESVRALDSKAPGGADVPMRGDQPMASHAGVIYVIGASGTRHQFTDAFDTRGGLNARFVSDVGTWLNALPDFRPGRGNGATASADKPGDWGWSYTTNYCYTTSPYGQLCYYGDWYRNNREAVSGYDWWNLRMETRTTPGYYLWGNSWRTDITWMTADTDFYVSTNVLDQYKPSTQTIGSSATYVGFETGMASGVLSADITSTQATGYYASNVAITQSSSPTYNDVSVRNAYVYGSTPTLTPISSYASWSERIDTTQNGGCYKTPYQNKVQWWDSSTSSAYQTWINSWRNVCP